uniref:Putative conjugal transfer protein (TrbD) n=1 Tax=Leptospirillum sp. Group II '5-way CG' TaxID=419541 RepID=B6AP95_9BACT|nr:MAG: Putative conjugal transfer protein (TrbD) [Leptospirillum sp. Group II '5-way CG']
MASRRTVPIHQSLVKPLLLAGGDRELVLFNVVLMAGTLFMMGLSVFSVSLTSLAGGLTHIGLVRMAKTDPQMRDVYLVFRKYRTFYPARPDARVKEKQKHRGAL